MELSSDELHFPFILQMVVSCHTHIHLGYNSQCHFTQKNVVTLHSLIPAFFIIAKVKEKPLDLSFSLKKVRGLRLSTKARKVIEVYAITRLF